MDLPRGLYCAMVTPLDKGQVTRHATEELIHALIDSEFAGVLVSGSTGEGPLLTDEQYRDIISIAVEAADHRLHVIAGATEPSVPRSLNRLKVAADLGADSGLVINPFYFKRGEADLVAYFSDLADQSPLPLILYNFPGTTGQRITNEEIMNLASHKRIVGYKDSSGDLASLHQLLLECDTGEFRIFQGLATQSYASLCIGVEGIFSATANIVPKLDSQILKTHQMGDFDSCRELQKLQIDLVRTLTVSGLPVGLGVKQAFRFLGKEGSDSCYRIRYSTDGKMIGRVLDEINAYLGGGSAKQ